MIIDAALAWWSAPLWLGGWWASGGRHCWMMLGWETSRRHVVTINAGDVGGHVAAVNAGNGGGVIVVVVVSVDSGGHRCRWPC